MKSVDFPYESHGDLGEVLYRALTGLGPGNIMKAIRDSDLEEKLDDIKEAFEPFRCGRLRRRQIAMEEKAYYTREEVSWFVSENTGMYSLVNDTMYDLTGKSPYLAYCP
jgi:hypothetical protein